MKIMARQAFEYTKTILKKMSFNPDLFQKELYKAYDTLVPHEIEELNIWLKSYLETKPEIFDRMKLVK
jgi:predicted SprT family Zn-dependent metalloprotease